MALCSALLVMSVSVMAVTIALPSIAVDLHATTSQLQWITEAAVLALASLLITMGALADRFGRRRLLMAGLAVFALASLLAAVSRTPEQLIATRALQGAGNAIITPATLAIVRDIFPRPELPRALAAWGVVASLGVVLGPLTGGVLVEGFGWRSLFVANVVVLAVAALAIAYVVPADPRPRRAATGRLDVIGALLVSGAFVATVHTVIEAPHRGWFGPVTLVEAAGAAALLAAFAIRQRRARHPLLDLRMVGARSFWPAALAAATGFFALMGVLFLITQYLQDVRGHSPSQAALLLLPVAVAQLGVAPLVARMVARRGVRPTATVGLLVLASGSALMVAGIRSGQYAAVIAGVAVLAAGNAVTVNASATAMLGSAPAHRSGSAAAVNETAFKVGGSLGVAVLGGLAAAHLAARLPAHQAASISGALDAARHLGGADGARLATTATAAFTDAFAQATTITAILAAAAGTVTILLLRDPEATKGHHGS
ncbi:drug resistance transporter, EmrB/QacA subfamily [Nonomuraea jiangxiensis]|uniref:Drug resistance transporter, EmrB/QacA subfamily n=1 Tax=Nonomuraea jiangxiensis TaxID=633440 RepID=A0A1G8YSI1_9ACTN|nr:drug resistance transporter, EmrB/QacA subfamily [Nonomuraea jiangxiensis]